MKTNILTLCDFAKDYNGQLNISGTFNQIRSAVFPTEPISFFIAMQFILKDKIDGLHEVTLSVTHKETGENLIPPQNFRLDVSQGNDSESDKEITTNLILGIDKIKFSSPGAFSVKVTSDGNAQEIDFYVIQIV